MTDERLPEHSIYTFTGRRFWPLQPKAEEVALQDIAHALSNICRFTGHTNHFYSVAQHSVLVSRTVPAEFALWGLLHDASEAYLADISRPVKQQMPFYQEAERRLEKVIASAFGLPWPMPAAVKEVDTRMLMTEKRDVLVCPWDFSRVHVADCQPYDFRIVPYSPSRAEESFFNRWHELLEVENGKHESQGSARAA